MKFAFFLIFLCFSAGIIIMSCSSSAPTDGVKLLNSLVVDDNQSCKGTNYSRDDWGGWKDADSDCQDSRAEVLIRSSVGPITYSSSSQCSVSTGSWRSPYNGVTYTVASNLDIDHLVPLGEAHNAGGCSWSSGKKADYANDLSNSYHLIAVDSSSNRSKGSRTPAEWLPSDTTYYCTYAVNWVQVKSTYSLTVSSVEKTKLQEILETCAASIAPLPSLSPSPTSTSTARFDCIDPSNSMSGCCSGRGGAYSCGTSKYYFNSSKQLVCADLTISASCTSGL